MRNGFRPYRWNTHVASVEEVFFAPKSNMLIKYSYDAFLPQMASVHERSSEIFDEAMAAKVFSFLFSQKLSERVEEDIAQGTLIFESSRKAII